MHIHYGAIRKRASALMAFTLVEVLVAEAVMILGALGLFGGIAYAFLITELARSDLRATQVILEKMEGIRLYTFDQLVSSNLFSTAFSTQYYPFARDGQSQGITYYGQLTVSDPGTGAAYNPNLRLVTISVSWTNVYGQSQVPHNRQMQTLVGRNGIQNYAFFN
jgi:Tfp pilus assembly protein PilV